MPATHTRPLPLVEIEARILALDDQLEAATERFADLSEDAAIAEATYKRRHSTAILNAEASSTRKINAAEKVAFADRQADDEFRLWRIADARMRSCREHLLSLRDRLGALRTLAANVRNQT